MLWFIYLAKLRTDLLDNRSLAILLETYKLLICYTLVFGQPLSGNPTFREVLRRVRKTTLAAYAHQDLPFADLVQTLEHEHHLRRRSLCQGMFILQNAMRQPAKLSDLTLRFIGADESIGELGLTVTAFDIVLTLWESPQGLAGSCIYKTTLFDATIINQMLEDYQRVLKRIIVQPERSLSTFGSPRGERTETREHGS
jgi:non-ribosomal peptide synthetase component F